MELMRLIHSSAQIFSSILQSFSTYAWKLSVDDFEFLEVADNMHLELEAFELNL